MGVLHAYAGGKPKRRSHPKVVRESSSYLTRPLPGAVSFSSVAVGRKLPAEAVNALLMRVKLSASRRKGFAAVFSSLDNGDNPIRGFVPKQVATNRRVHFFRRLTSKKGSMLPSHAFDIPFTSPTKTKSRMSGVFDALNAFKNLKRGWDTYSAPPPAIPAIADARVFLIQLFMDSLYPERVAPSVVGGVGITVRNKESWVYVEFRNDGGASLLLANDGLDEPLIRPIAKDPSSLHEAIDLIKGFLDE